MGEMINDQIMKKFFCSKITKFNGEKDKNSRILKLLSIRLKLDNWKRFYISRRSQMQPETEAEDRTLDEIDTQEEDVVESIFNGISTSAKVKIGGTSPWRHYFPCGHGRFSSVQGMTRERKRLLRTSGLHNRSSRGVP